MNAVMTFATAADQLQRYDAIRRKNAESAYSRNVQYNGQNQKIVDHLEALLLGKKEPENSQLDRKGLQELSGGQAKQIFLPVGKTLEETIDIWRDVRTEAISEPEPTTADYQLAAKASAKIMYTEAQIALHNKAASMEQHPDLQRRFEKAISSYSFQVEMKQRGFQIGWPDFFKSA